MSQEAERVYTINLGKVWLSPNNQRAKRAINMIREFATHHMKTEQIKIDQELSQAVWKRGIRRPPRKIRVKMAKADDGYVLVSTYEEETKAVESKVEEKPKDKKAKKQPEPKAEVKEPKVKAEEPKEKPEPKKAEKKPAEPKKEAPKETPKESKPKKEEKKEVKKSETKKPSKKSK